MMKIGETFEQDKKEYVITTAETFEDCYKCAFYADGEGCVKSPQCIGSWLQGKEKVYFVEVKK